MIPYAYLYNVILLPLAPMVIPFNMHTPIIAMISSVNVTNVPAVAKSGASLQLSLFSASSDGGVYRGPFSLTVTDINSTLANTSYTIYDGVFTVQVTLRRDKIADKTKTVNFLASNPVSNHSFAQDFILAGDSITLALILIFIL